MSCSLMVNSPLHPSETGACFNPYASFSTPFLLASLSFSLSLQVLAAFGHILHLELYRPCDAHHYGEIHMHACSPTHHYMYRVNRLSCVHEGTIGCIKVFVNLLHGLYKLSNGSGSRKNFICQLNNSHSWINSCGHMLHKLQI